MPVFLDLPPRPGKVQFSEREHDAFAEVARKNVVGETVHDTSYDTVVEAAGHCALTLLDNSAQDIYRIRDELLSQIPSEVAREAFNSGFVEQESVILNTLGETENE
jgi:hypothetical protein